MVAGGHQILEVDALAIGPGEAVAIVGASGAGKSSLVGLLLGWHRPATGALRIDGAPLDGAGIEALRRRTVWIDPAVYLWNRSLADNLAFGLAATPDGLGAVLDEAELGEVVRRLPQGLATPLGEAGGLVSGGEGQRVRFGRGLLRERPRLVILDEPFRGLSRDQRQALLARARRRWSSATLLCVTHDIAETAAFPRVLVIADGRIAEDGPPAALLAQPGSRYAALAEAERRVRAAAWSGDRWRRLRLEDRADRGAATVSAGLDPSLDDCLWPLDRRDELTAALASAAGIAQLGPADRFELSYADVAPALTARARAEAPAVLRVGSGAGVLLGIVGYAGADVRLLAPGGAVVIRAGAALSALLRAPIEASSPTGVETAVAQAGFAGARGESVRAGAAGRGAGRRAGGRRGAAPPGAALDRHGPARRRRRAPVGCGAVGVRRSARAAGRALGDDRHARGGGEQPRGRRLGLDRPRRALGRRPSRVVARRRPAGDRRRRGAARSDPARPLAPRHRAAARGGDRPPHGAGRRRRGGRVAGARRRPHRGRGASSSS